MTDITSYLPAWLVAAAVPAGAVMAFFWKGDEAIGPDMKDWLSRKIVGENQAQGSTSAGKQVSTIDSLLRVFDAVYKTKSNGLPSFLRVALISTAALLIICFSLTLGAPSDYLKVVLHALFQFDSISH